MEKAAPLPERPLPSWGPVIKRFLALVTRSRGGLVPTRRARAAPACGWRSSDRSRTQLGLGRGRLRTCREVNIAPPRLGVAPGFALIELNCSRSKTAVSGIERSADLGRAGARVLR